MPDYIPGGDAEFGAWLGNFVTYANTNLAALGLVAGGMTPITAAQTTWASKWKRCQDEFPASHKSS